MDEDESDKGELLELLGPLGAREMTEDDEDLIGECFHYTCGGIVKKLAPGIMYSELAECNKCGSRGPIACVITKHGWPVSLGVLRKQMSGETDLRDTLDSRMNVVVFGEPKKMHLFFRGVFSFICSI